MEIRLTPEQEAAILQIAQHEGKTPEDLIMDALSNVSDYDLPTQEILRHRLHQADRGTFLEQEEIDSRIQKMLGR